MLKKRVARANTFKGATASKFLRTFEAGDPSGRLTTIKHTQEGGANKTRSLFKTAAGLWMNNTCINFYQDENETSVDLLVVIKEYGCWSEVGRQGDWQFMSLDGGCETVLDQKSFNLKPRNF
ncbi:astacin [Ostertagia ostertagi]